MCRFFAVGYGLAVCCKIQHCIFVSVQKFILIQLQHRCCLFNYIHPSSTRASFVQKEYLFNFNAHGTNTFIQIQQIYFHIIYYSTKLHLPTPLLPLLQKEERDPETSC